MVKRGAQISGQTASCWLSVDYCLNSYRQAQKSHLP